MHIVLLQMLVAHIFMVQYTKSCMLFVTVTETALGYRKKVPEENPGREEEIQELKEAVKTHKVSFKGIKNLFKLFQDSFRTCLCVVIALRTGGSGGQ